MIEATILDYLAEKLDVPVFLEIPETPSEEYEKIPDEFVLIQRVGGTKRNMIMTSSFAFQSYAQRLSRAIKIDMAVRDAMDVITMRPDIQASHMASNYNFTDTTLKRYRYQCTYDITHS